MNHEHSIANVALSDSALVACPSCDLVQRLPQLDPGASARCPRCGVELWRPRKDSLSRTLALTLTALVLYLLANLVPMLGLTTLGHASFTTIAGGAQRLWTNGQPIVAVLVFFAAVFAPGFQISVLLAVLIGCLSKNPSSWVGAVLRHRPFSRTWSMVEVMLLGVLVALTKIADYATVIPGIALFSAFGLVVVFTAIQSSFDPREVWNRIQWAEPGARGQPGNQAGLEVAS
jgi:paraquat-inducible protein A